MNAPVCPVSYSQIRVPTSYPRLPAIPAAYDLASLIAAINAMANAIRNMTSNVTINNVYNPPPPSFTTQPDTLYGTVPLWVETGAITVDGIVYHHDGRKTDPTQKARVRRTNAVYFQSESGEPLNWSYVLRTDA